jgi:hypothetical protein
MLLSAVASASTTPTSSRSPKPKLRCTGTLVSINTLSPDIMRTVGFWPELRKAAISCDWFAPVGS